MKDTIYTIPLTDAFQSGDECPFCFIYRKLEQDALSFTLGASYMQDDIRTITDEMGFCSSHYKKLYDYGNKLGFALILHTHYQHLYNDLSKALSAHSLSSLSFFQKLTKKKLDHSESPIHAHLNHRMDTCFICERVDTHMERYAKTFFYLFSHQPEFKQLVIDSKGFCLTHFSFLLEFSPLYLKEDLQIEFFELTKSKLLESIKRIEDDLSWFIDKYDYRNTKAPWKNAKDAIPRSIQKIAGIYVQDEPFKES